LYRSISKVQLGDGGRCGFWLDDWLPLGALHAAMPALYSHTTDVRISIRDVLRLGLSTVLVPRLTTAVESERRRLATLLDSVRLNDGPNVRVLTRCGSPSGRLRSAELYKLVGFGGVQAPLASFVWDSHAPARVKFFGWLLSLGRIQTRDSLLQKNILARAAIGCPVCPAVLETANHLVFGCPFAQAFWTSAGVCFDQNSTVEAMLDPACCRGVPERSLPMFLILCCWHIWKHRNGVVFNGDDPSLARVKLRCRDDAVFWRARLPTAARKT
jgi:hypothetical protein